MLFFVVVYLLLFGFVDQARRLSRLELELWDNRQFTRVSGRPY